MPQRSDPANSIDINDENVLITLHDARVEVISFSYVIDFEVYTSSDIFTVKFITPFEIVSATGSIVVDPESDHQLCSTVLSLLRRSVANISSTAAGLLVVRFEDGTVLRSRCHDQYEAWHLRGPDGSLIVALPGGGVAIWEPDLSDKKENTR
jgi:hypothetical protein